MPLYRYKAVDGSGAVQAGSVEAEAPRQVRELLKAASLVPVDVRPSSGSRPWLTLGLSRAQRTEAALLPSQLATLLEAGVPLAKALEVMSRNVTGRRLAAALSRIGDAVRRGTSLSEALRGREPLFDSTFCSMVAAGEASGELARSLWQLAEYKEEELETQSRVSSALAYPAFVTAVGVLICGFLIVFVIPRISHVLETSGRRLPWLTQTLLAMGDFLRGYWWALLLGGLALAYGLMRLRRRPRIGEWIDRWKLRLPLFGPVVTKALIARWARTFAVLLRSGLTVTQALDVLEKMTENRHFRREIEGHRRRIEAGESLGDTGDSASVMPPLVRQMIAVGESAGELDRVLDHLARVYSRECDIVVKRLLALLEPMLIVVLGGCVLLVIMAVLVPILEMNRMI